MRLSKIGVRNCSWWQLVHPHGASQLLTRLRRVSHPKSNILPEPPQDDRDNFSGRATPSHSTNI